MEKVFYVVVCFLIFAESAIYQNYPFNSIALSFLGYMAYRRDIKIVWFLIYISLVIGFSGYNLVFFILYAIVLYYIYKSMVFTKINVIIISFIEVLMYVSYIYFFKIKEIWPHIWIEEFIFISFYNIIFYNFDKNLKK